MWFWWRCCCRNNTGAGICSNSQPCCSNCYACMLEPRCCPHAYLPSSKWFVEYSSVMLDGVCGFSVASHVEIQTYLQLQGYEIEKYVLWLIARWGDKTVVHAFSNLRFKSPYWQQVCFITGLRLANVVSLIAVFRTSTCVGAVSILVSIYACNFWVCLHALS